MDHWWLPVLGFACGSIPFGLLISRLRGVDLRAVGSGNIGATNVLRSQGKAWGILTLLLDAAKGFAPSWLAWSAGPEIAALTGFAAVAGHCYSFFLKGRGGKGVATGLGVYLALAPAAVGIAAAVFVLTVAWKRFVSLGSLLAALTLPAATFGLRYPLAISASALAAGVIIGWRHRDNVKRLLNGTENRLGARKGRA